MSEVNLGKAAYEAFTNELGAHRLEGDELEGPWTKLPLRAQRAWEAAAHAVLFSIHQASLDAQKKAETKRLPEKAST